MKDDYFKKELGKERKKERKRNEVGTKHHLLKRNEAGTKTAFIEKERGRNEIVNLEERPMLLGSSLYSVKHVYSGLHVNLEN